MVRSYLGPTFITRWTSDKGDKRMGVKRSKRLIPQAAPIPSVLVWPPGSGRGQVCVLRVCVCQNVPSLVLRPFLHEQSSKPARRVN